MEWRYGVVVLACSGHGRRAGHFYETRVILSLACQQSLLKSHNEHVSLCGCECVCVCVCVCVWSVRESKASKNKQQHAYPFTTADEIHRGSHLKLVKSCNHFL